MYPLNKYGHEVLNSKQRIFKYQASPGKEPKTISETIMCFCQDGTEL